MKYYFYNSLRNRKTHIGSFIVALFFFVYTWNWYFIKTNKQLREELRYTLKSSFHQSFNRTENLIILEVIKNSAQKREYHLAMETVQCYAAMHGYDYLVLYSENNTICEQEDFMFQRHCLVVEFMKANPQFKWILFMDADIGVINPLHRIQEYIEPDESGIDLIFYNRMFNCEIASGSFLIRNTKYSQEFLTIWANYYYILPDSFHGSDNGAIHAVFMQKFAPSNRLTKCDYLWHISKNFSMLYDYEACVRHITNDVTGGLIFEEQNQTTSEVWGRIKMLEKGKSWVRDGGSTNTRFGTKDFMFHGWKQSTMNKGTFNPWIWPFKSTHFLKNSCQKFLSTTAPENSMAYKNWDYLPDLRASDEEIQKILEKVIATTQEYYQSTLKRLNLST